VDFNYLWNQDTIINQKYHLLTPQQGKDPITSNFTTNSSVTSDLILYKVLYSFYYSSHNIHPHFCPHHQVSRYYKHMAPCIFPAFPEGAQGCSQMEHQRQLVPRPRSEGFPHVLEQGPEFLLGEAQAGN
jgi:hypothetical protein